MHRDASRAERAVGLELTLNQYRIQNPKPGILGALAGTLPAHFIS
jgi:hypothetical protein